MNYFRTAVLLAVMTALFMSVGLFIGGETGMIIAFCLALAINLWSFWNSDKAVLSMHGAREVGPNDAPEYYSIVRQLAENADLPMPRTFVMYSDQPNAFATGRNPDNAAVCATTGLLDILTKEEIAGVMAHELAHIKNRDTLIMTVTATLAGAISMLANFGLLFGGRNNNSPYGWVGTIVVMLVAPLAAGIVQMAISRSREYEADRQGAEICQRPAWLASALEQISRAAEGTPIMSAERNPATAHMFIYNPLSGERMDNLFSTHPNVENRIQRLDALAREWGQLGDTPSTLADAGPWSKDAQPKGPWD